MPSACFFFEPTAVSLSPRTLWYPRCWYVGDFISVAAHMLVAHASASALAGSRTLEQQ
jgi:hypothetical protein